MFIFNQNLISYNPKMINIKCKSVRWDLRFKIKSNCYKLHHIKKILEVLQTQLHKPKSLSLTRF